VTRLPRIVILGYPHHVTQRGNRRAQTFFKNGGYDELYGALLSEAAQKAETEIWCYYLSPNLAHMIVVPSGEDGLRRTFADTHRRYAGHTNARS